jgi:putative transposase
MQLVERHIVKKSHSNYLENKLVELNISTLVIGKNEAWKQEINIGSRNNQNFVQVPHSRFIEQLTYSAIRFS